MAQATKAHASGRPAHVAGHSLAGIGAALRLISGPCPVLSIAKPLSSSSRYLRAD
jgi:hypothetical protein